MFEKLLSIVNTNYDKAFHFCGGYILSTIFPIPIIYGLILAVIAGIGKEIYDKYHVNHTSENLDMYFTVLGGLFGFVALLLKKVIY